MTTDIVERLRACATHGVSIRPETAIEAADEIERLAALLKAKVTPGYELLADQIEQRDAEIERLTAALEKEEKHLRGIGFLEAADRLKRALEQKA